MTLRISVVPARLAVSNYASFRTCYREERVRHIVDFGGCDCLRVELPSSVRALSSGRLMALHPVSVHQNDCSTAKCGGEFQCQGCKRAVGWCMGGGSALGEEHCDDCFCDRLAVMERCAEGRVNTKALLAAYDTPDVCKRPMLTVARELCEDGFLDFRRNGRFVLTARGRAEVSTPTAGGRAPEVRS